MSPPRHTRAVPCTVCNTPSPLAWRHPEADLYRCPACDHCFSDAASIVEQEQYGPKYYEESHRNWFDHPNVRLFDKLHTFISGYKSPVSVIDVGCGRGDLLKFLHERSPDWDLTGVDISSCPEAAGIEFHRGNAFEIDFGRRFDVVISLAVIEHVADVHTFVRKLHELCVPGGLVILLTVNDRSLTYGTARTLNRLGLSSPFNRLYSKHHVNHFNFHSLHRLLTAENLEVLKTIRHHSPLAAIDVPAKDALTATVLRSCAWGLFQVERLTGRTILQTVLCRTKSGMTRE
jgi:2-polyprenyl-3-methyl-5-hydroxy-6-metoxy-1,4-benzoquinol methylase